ARPAFPARLLSDVLLHIQRDGIAAGLISVKATPILGPAGGATGAGLFVYGSTSRRRVLGKRAPCTSQLRTRRARRSISSATRRFCGCAGRRIAASRSTRRRNG